MAETAVLRMFTPPIDRLRLVLHSHLQLYVLYREPSAALRLLKSACIQVADDYFKAGPMEERS